MITSCTKSRVEESTSQLIKPQAKQWSASFPELPTRVGTHPSCILLLHLLFSRMLSLQRSMHTSNLVPYCSDALSSFALAQGEPSCSALKFFLRTVSESDHQWTPQGTILFQCRPNAHQICEILNGKVQVQRHRSIKPSTPPWFLCLVHPRVCSMYGWKIIALPVVLGINFAKQDTGGLKIIWDGPLSCSGRQLMTTMNLQLAFFFSFCQNKHSCIFQCCMLILQPDSRHDRQFLWTTDLTPDTCTDDTVFPKISLKHH